MNQLALLVISSILMGNPFIDRFNEGGPLMMSLILICFILSIIFLVKGFMGLKSAPILSNKMLKLAVDSSLLGLV
ncbi:MAG: hypothetical protein KDD18_07630, partial [Mangrovimonas sp.]|nr:hypothetical protein [Mangrovimonas sp.]